MWALGAWHLESRRYELEFWVSSLQLWTWGSYLVSLIFLFFSGKMGLKT